MGIGFDGIEGPTGPKHKGSCRYHRSLVCLHSLQSPLFYLSVHWKRTKYTCQQHLSTLCMQAEQIAAWHNWDSAQKQTLSGRLVGSSQEMKKGFGARSGSSKRDMVATDHVRALPSGSVRSMGLCMWSSRLEVASAPSSVSMQNVSSSHGLSPFRGVSLTNL